MQAAIEGMRAQASTMTAEAPVAKAAPPAPPAPAQAAQPADAVAESRLADTNKEYLKGVLASFGNPAIRGAHPHRPLELSLKPN